MMDRIIILCAYNIVREDDQDIMVLAKETEVFAEEQGLSNGFYFRSTAEGLRVVTSYLIHPFEYNGEQRIKDHGRLLKIERTRPLVKDGMDLLEVIVGELDGS